MARMDRRGFLTRSAAAALAVSGGVLLQACGERDETGAAPGAAGPQLASPANPVTWPIAPGNEPIADGLQPERGATLKVYNWTEYIYKDVVTDFEKKYAKYDVKVQVSTYGNMDEAVAKLRGGQVAFDVLFPTYDFLGKLVQGGFLRPLNHSYIENIDQVWPVFQNPFYDQGWHYSVPYTIYTSGIAWRVDKVEADVAGLANPWEALWDERYKGKVGILDDYREAIAMTLLKNGITDVNTGEEAHLSLARDQLVDLAKRVRPRVNTNDYIDLPEAKTWITHAWSGDMVNAQYYMPKGQSAEVMRYWFPPDGRGLVNSDLIVLLRSGKNPVLGHLFLNHLLDYDVAVNNMSWNGYQPPQTKLDPGELVAQELLPPNLKTATVLPAWFDTGYRLLELSPEVDNRWHAAWQEFKAGA
jgi:spermidine/putrescine transport system substrate-binding protein